MLRYRQTHHVAWFRHTVPACTIRCRIHRGIRIPDIDGLMCVLITQERHLHFILLYLCNSCVQRAACHFLIADFRHFDALLPFQITAVEQLAALIPALYLVDITFHSVQ